MKTGNFIRSISILFFMLLSYSSIACLYTVTIWDAYGDGWNGGSITVFVNGTPVLNEISFADGYGGISYTFNINPGDVISISVIDGSYVEEMYYYVYDGVGTQIFMDGCTDYSCNGPVGGLVNLGLCPDIDLGVASWDTPYLSCNMSSTEIISVTYHNYGNLPQSSFTCSYSLDAGFNWINESVTSTLLPGQSYTHTFAITGDFSLPGTHNCIASVTCTGDQVVSNDQLPVALNNSSFFSIFPYSESFESGPGGWYSAGQNSSWGHGVPNGSYIYYANSGTNCWVTNPIGNYNNNEQSYVESPCFDFSLLTNPFLDFYYWIYTYEDYDGAQIQYTIDGVTWHTIGDVNYPPNPSGWYNIDYIQGLSFTGNTIGWSSAGFNWLYTEHPLEFLAGEPFVKFRFVWGSDGSYNYYDGFAFDDFSIFEPPLQTWSSTTVEQSELLITSPGMTNQRVLRIGVEMNSSTNPLAVTRFDCNTTGSSSSADIAGARMFYTGNDNNFNDQNQFGSDAFPLSPFSFIDSILMMEGMNYFWLVYDVATNATLGNVLDAVIDSLLLGGNVMIPTAPNPTGNILIVPQLSGTYTIDPLGSGPMNYLSFSSAVADINEIGVSGPVTFNVASGVYTEQITLFSYPGMDPAKPITFQSATGDPTSVNLTFAPFNINMNFTVRLNGACNLIFQNLTLSSTGADFSRVVETGHMANNNQFIGNRIIGPIVTTSYDYKVLFYSYWYNDNDYLIENNYFYGGSYGLYLQNDGSSNYEQGYVIQNNSFIEQNYVGIYGYRQEGTQIIGNIIHSTSINSSYGGIWLYSCINQLRILSNHITRTANGGNGIYLEYCGGTLTKSTGNAWIGNNFISINSLGTTYATGIEIYYGFNFDILYNSVNIYGNYTGSRAFYLNFSNTGITCSNNLFINNSMGYSMHVDPAVTLSSDYNDLFTNGNNLAWYGNNLIDLPAWQLAVYDDINSISVLPVFVSDSNLHTNSIEVYQMGIPVPEILDDIDGEPRDLTSSCLGADEFLPPPIDAWLMEIIYPTIECGLGVENIEILVRNVGLDPFTGFTASYDIDNSGVPVSEFVNVTILPGDSLYYTFTATYDFSSPGDSSFTIDAWINLTGDLNAINDSLFENIFSGYLPSAPIVSDITVTGGENAVLTAISPDIVSWFLNDVVPFPMNVGSPYTVGPMYETHTFYAHAMPDYGEIEPEVYCSSGMVPLTVYVNGSPDITVSELCLNLTPIMQYTSAQEIFNLGNTGNYILNIDSLYNSDPAFTYNLNDYSINPFETQQVTVNFSPTIVGTYVDTIWIISNDVDTFVCLTAEAFDPPDIDLNPDSVYIVLNCDDTLDFPLTVINNGLGILEYDVSLGNAVEYYQSIQYFTTTGQSTYHNFIDLRPISDSLEVTITINGDYNSTSEYVSIYIDGDNIGQFQGGTTYSDLSITYTFSGTQLDGWLADGVIMVEMDNSASVNTGYGTNLNEVELNLYHPDWIQALVSSGIVNPLSSDIFNFSLISTNQNVGIYNSLVNISSNDPLNPSEQVIVYIEIIGNPEIDFDVICADFDSIMELTTSEEFIEITNIGCDTLVIDSIQNTLSVFASLSSGFTLLPGETEIISVDFSPLSIGLYEDTLEFYGNIPDTGICVVGVALGSPTIEIDPDTIELTIAACCDTITVPVTISNSGVIDLTYEIQGVGLPGQNGNSLTSILNNLNLNYPLITNEIPNMYSFTNGVISNYISDGGNDMYDGGNYLNTNLGSQINYSDNIIINSTAFGGTSQNYFTRKFDGLFVMVADLDGVSEFSITGNLGADGSGIVDGAILPLSHNGINYLGFVKRTYNAGDPSVNHLVIVEYNQSIVHNFGLDSDDDYHQIANLWNANRIFYLLYASAQGAYVDDATSLSIMTEFLEVINLTPEWISTPELIDTVSASGNLIVDFIISSCDLSSGLYSTNIIFSSNDPVNPLLVLPVSIELDGVPEMLIVDTCLTFGTIMQYTSLTQSFDIENIGCDTLWITGITNTLSEYTLSANSLFLLPGEIETINVDFSPLTNNAFIDTIYITSNAGDYNICLSGGAIGAPEVIAVPDSFEFTLFSCNDSLVVPLDITNIGLSDLEFSLGTSKTGSNVVIGTPKVVLITDNVTSANNVENQLISTGLFTLSDIDVIAYPNPLTSAMLVPYDAALVWSDGGFANATAVGDTLKKFVDNGGGVVLATYALNSSSYGLAGGIFQPNYSPFLASPGVAVSGIIDILSVSDPSHPVFENITSNIAYWINANNSNTSLNIGGVLLAQDTWGNNVVGVNELGNIIGINIFPSNLASGNAEARLLFANSLISVSNNVDWISFSLFEDTLGILETSFIDVQFNTNGLTNGQYIANIVINSNDPLTPQLFVPCTLNINSDPVMDIYPNCLMFPPIMQWTNLTDTFVIYNNGCDTLKVTNVSNLLPVYTLDKTSFDVLPDEFEVVTVSFSPNSIGIFEDTVLIETNDHDTTICLSGEGFGAPIITTVPGQLDFVLNDCYEVDLDQITISNTGTEDLIWNFIGGYGISYDSTSIENYVNSGATTNHVFNPPFATTDSITLIVTINGDFDSSNEYATLVVEGQSFGVIPDNNYSNGSNIEYTIQLGGNDVQLWLQDGLIEVSIVNSTAVNHWSGLVSMHKVQLIIDGVDWMSFSQSSGIVTPGNSVVIDVFAESQGLITGLYNANINLFSNDPLTPTILIPVSLLFNGYPVIELSDICLTIDSVMAGLTETEILTISNSGCDTLFVTGISNQLTEFTSNLNSFFLPPGISQDIVVSFTSGGTSVSLDTLVILNNDIDTTVCLLGTGIGVPIIDLYPDPIIINSTGCDITPFSIYVGNDGNEDLTWSTIDINSTLITDNFDPNYNSANWNSISGGYAFGSCGAYSGTNALYFNGSGERSASTIDMDMVGGGIVSFYLRIGTGSSPCENADGGEDVALQYSVDGGINWINITIYDSELFPNWTLIEEDVPIAAQTGSVQFRWYQISHSGSGFDNWSIDNVGISGSSFGIALSVNSGVVISQDSTEVIFTIDATGLNAGTYTNILEFISNDPYNSILNVPVVLNINMTSLVADAGLDDTLSLGSSMVLPGLATGGNTPYQYLWTPIDELSNPMILNPIASPLTDIVYSLIVEDATGCISTDDISIHIMYSVSGVITYNNSNNEPVAGVWAILKDNLGVKLDSSLTDITGNYLIEGVENGEYTLDVNVTGSWGGGNATDALEIRRHVVMLEPLYGLPMAAADVNASNSVSSFDALYVLRRTVGYTSGFPAGDWVSHTPTVYINNSNAIYHYMVMCYGDVNGSHIINPTKTIEPKVHINMVGSMLVNNNNFIEVPVYVENLSEIGAITLSIVYPENSFEFVELIDFPDGMIYKDHFGVLKIAWENTTPINVNSTEPLFKIKLYVIGELENIEFSVLAESEFADANGNIFNDVKLIIPEIIDGFSTGEFFIAENHPNPFTDYTYIDYYLPDDGFVILEVKDLLGRNIQTLTNSNQSAGKYQVKFDGVGLANGAYIYNITYIKGPDRITKSQIMNILR